MSSTGYSLRAAGKRHEMLLYGEVGGGWFGGVDAKAIAEDLSKIPADRPLDVRINSPGGDVFEGVAIASLLRQRPEVVVYVDGVAASIASVVAVSGTELVMNTGTRLMIHDPWTITIGGSNEHRRQADHLESVRNDLLGFYIRKAGDHRRQQLDDAMAAETWYGADEAVAAGLADRVSAGRAQVAASIIAPGRYQRTPADLLATNAWAASMSKRALQLRRAGKKP